MLPFRIIRYTLCYCTLEVSDFLFDFTGITVKRLPLLRRAFGLLNSVETVVKTMERDYETKCILHSDYNCKRMGDSEWNMVFRRLIYFHAWSPAGELFGED